MVSFCSAKVFKFKYVPFVYLCFCFLCLRKHIQKKNIATVYVKECLCFLLGLFMVSVLTFRSLIHFELIFVHSVRKYFNFLLLHVAFQFSQHHYGRDHLFPIVYSCLLCCTLIDNECVALFLRSLFCFIDICVCFCASIILIRLL